MKNAEFLLTKIKEHSKAAAEAYVIYLKDESRINFNNLSMECFQVSNYLISLSELAIEKQTLGFPFTYADIFRILKDKKIITDEELRSGTILVSIRNRIAHEYYEIDKETLLDVFKSIKKLETTIGKIYAKAK